MNEEPIHIDMSEISSFISKRAKEEGFDLSEEIIDLVLELEDEFLESKGLLTEISDEK
ncbi:hypothetical protein ACQPV1_21655 [Clostridium neonatale]|uniref:hypothetical protein n=1 Tax=Clostridium neonatale TaxID=137838 RepID=UPI003D34BF88